MTKEDTVQKLCKWHLKKFLERHLPQNYEVVIDYKYEISKGKFLISKYMQKKPIFRQGLFGTGNDAPHQDTIKGLLNTLPSEYIDSNGVRFRYNIASEIDYNRAGIIGKRPLGEGEKNYNFDIAVVNVETKEIEMIVEVERSYRSPRTRHKLSDCLRRIPSLKHAIFIEVIGDNPYQFNFCELVKGEFPSTRKQGRINDGCTEIEINEILGVPTQVIESQVRKYLSLLNN